MTSQKNLTIFFLFGLLMIFINTSTIAQEDNDKKEAERLKVLSLHFGNINKMIEDPKVPLEKVINEMTKLDKMQEGTHDIDTYCGSIFVLCERLNVREEIDDDTLATIRKFRVKVMSVRLENYNLTEDKLVELRARFLSGTGSRDIFLSRRENLSDCDPAFRRWFAEQVVSLYQSVVKHYDANFFDDGGVVIQPFQPPDSYKGETNANVDYSKVEDEATRIAFKEYVKEREKNEEFNRTRDLKFWAWFTHRMYKELGTLQKLLSHAYSLHPFKTLELEELMTKYKLDPAIANAVLKEVREAEKRFPEDGFRIWQSKDKLFKADAKFIAVKNDEVTLEKRNKKQTSIEISVLRHDDQEYIKRATNNKK
jgi:hypothetical protein